MDEPSTSPALSGSALGQGAEDGAARPFAHQGDKATYACDMWLLGGRFGQSNQACTARAFDWVDRDRHNFDYDTSLLSP